MCSQQFVQKRFVTLATSHHLWLSVSSFWCQRSLDSIWVLPLNSCATLGKFARFVGWISGDINKEAIQTLYQLTLTSGSEAPWMQRPHLKQQNTRIPFIWTSALEAWVPYYFCLHWQKRRRWRGLQSADDKRGGESSRVAPKPVLPDCHLWWKNKAHFADETWGMGAGAEGSQMKPGRLQRSGTILLGSWCTDQSGPLQVSVTSATITPAAASAGQHVQLSHYTELFIFQMTLGFELQHQHGLVIWQWHV